MTPSQYDPRYQDLLPQDPEFKMCKFKTDKVMCFAAGEYVKYHPVCRYEGVKVAMPKNRRIVRDICTASRAGCCNTLWHV